MNDEIRQTLAQWRARKAELLKELALIDKSITLLGHVLESHAGSNPADVAGASSSHQAGAKAVLDPSASVHEPRRGRPRKQPDDSESHTREVLRAALYAPEVEAMYRSIEKPHIGAKTLFRPADPDDEIPEVDMKRELRLDTPIGRVVKFLQVVGEADPARMSAALGMGAAVMSVVLKTLYDGGYLKKVGLPPIEYRLDFDPEFPPQRGALREAMREETLS